MPGCTCVCVAARCARLFTAASTYKRLIWYLHSACASSPSLWRQWCGVTVHFAWEAVNGVSFDTPFTA